jgi:predicted HicB family RNase H-like nuclease
VKELRQEFQKAVEDYISFCKKNGNPVQKSLMGSFNIRIKPDIHQRAALVALQKNISLNQLVQQAIERELSLVDEKAEIYSSKRVVMKKVSNRSKG